MIDAERLDLAEEIERFRRFFPGRHLDMVIASMLAGNTDGQLWSVSAGNGDSLVLLWDRGNNVLYLAGGDPSSEAIESLADVVATRIRPAAIEGGRRDSRRVRYPPRRREACDLFFMAFRCMNPGPCSTDNIGSVRVAEKAGFRLMSEEMYWIGVFT